MAQQLAKCIGTSVTPPKVDTAEKSAVHSQDFSDGNNQITSEAKPALDVAAQKTFNKEVIASPKSGDCFAKVLSASAVGAAPGAKVQNIKTTVAGPKSGQPDSVQVNFDVRFDVVGQGKSQTFAFSTASILTDTIEAEVDVVGIGGAVPDSVKSAAIDAVAKRVAAA